MPLVVAVATGMLVCHLAACGHPRGDHQLDRLLAKLDSEIDFTTKIEIAQALGRCGDAQAVPGLVKSSVDNDESVRAASVEALAAIAERHPNLIDAIACHVAAAASDRSRTVREAAVAALDVLDVCDTTSVMALVGVAAGADERNVRRSALDALVDLGPRASESASHLLGLARMDPDLLCRVLAAQIVWHVTGDASTATDAVRFALRHGDSAARCEACRVLARMKSEGARAVPDLVHALISEDIEYVEAEMATTLCAVVPEESEVVDSSTIEALSGLLANDRYVSLAAFLLGRMGGAAKGAVAALESASQDSSAERRRAARTALARISHGGR